MIIPTITYITNNSQVTLGWQFKKGFNLSGRGSSRPSFQQGKKLTFTIIDMATDKVMMQMLWLGYLKGQRADTQ